MQLQSGRIKTLRADKGFGFITGADHLDYFFHATDVADGPRFDDLTEGHAVTFERDDDSTRGPRARHVVAAGV